MKYQGLNHQVAKLLENLSLWQRLNSKIIYVDGGMKNEFMK